MRKMRVRCLLGLIVAAALVTLLGPFPLSSSTPSIQERNFTIPSRLSLSDTAAGGGLGGNISENKDNKPSPPLHRSFTKSPVEMRAEMKVEKTELKQEALDLSHDAYIENSPPEDWVEVKKTRPKNGGREERPAEKRRYGKGGSRMKFSAKPTGLSPQQLKRRAASFPESSPLRAFLREQARRVSHVVQACRSFAPSLAEVVSGSRGPPVGLLTVKDIIYDRKSQLTFCPVYKAASTSWTITLLQMGGYWTRSTQKKPLQKLVKMFYPRMSGLAAASITSNTTHFMVVRHPLERLLSCYRDKFQNATKDYYYHLYGEKIIRRYRTSLSGLSPDEVTALQKEVREVIGKNNGVTGKEGSPVNLPHNPFANPLGPSFFEFAQHVINTKYDDEHWRTYASHCAPCTLTYDFVFRFESLEEETELFLEYLNKTGEVAPRWDNHNKRAETKQVFCDYYSQLPLDVIDKLVEKYQKDLVMYEYDAEEYRKCAKDYVGAGGGGGGGGGGDGVTTALATIGGDNGGGGGAVGT